MTESSPGLTYPIFKSSNLDTIGPPIANTLGVIMDPNGEHLSPGLHGELCFKGPQASIKQFVSKCN